MSILFINGSPNKDGNTVKLAERLLTGKNTARYIWWITSCTVMDRILRMTNLRRLYQG